MTKNRIVKIIFIGFFIGLIFLFIPGVKSTVKPYYSGDVIFYNNDLFIGTTNTGIFELFALKNKRLVREIVIKSDDPKYRDFHDLVFVKESGRLFVYLVNGNFLYKYDISNPEFIYLVDKKHDNSNDYFFGLSAIKERIITAGADGLKIWNFALEITNSFAVVIKDNKNVVFHDNGNYFNNLDSGVLEIIDVFYRDIVVSEPLDMVESHNHGQFIDSVNATTYLVDDSALRKISFTGESEEWRHISHVGYDVSSVPAADYIYFSDGVGVVKSKKSDLMPLKWKFTTNIGPGNGWAMGLKAAREGDSELIVIFNGSAIVVLDDNLNLVDYYAAREVDISPVEPLFINLDRQNGFPGQMLNVNGGGFSVNEQLEIKIDKEVFYTHADSEGRFNEQIIIPYQSSPGFIDIKVNGLASGLTYSIAFEVW